MANVIASGVEKRDAQFRARLGVLSYEHYQLTARAKEIEAEIGQLEAAIETNAQTRKDLETEATVEAAKKEKDG